MPESTTRPEHRNVETVSRLEDDALRGRSLAEHLSDVLTKAIGSLTSIMLHICWFFAWIVINVGLLPGIEPFDPFPFGILTLIVSTEGVLLALIILISQNRMIRQADRRAHLDLQVSLLAEQETTLLLRTMLRVSRQLGLPEDTTEAEANTLARRTDLNEMMQSLEKQLPKS